MSSLEDFNINNNLKKHICSFCGFRTHKKYNLDRHNINKHRNEKLKTSYMQSNSHQNPLVAQNQYLQNKVNELQDGNRFQNTFSKNQATQTEQTLTFRPRSRLDNDDKSNENLQDFLLESDSEESDINVAHELEDSITNMDIYFTNIVSERKRYLKTLEKYDNEIERKEKRDIFNKYIKERFLEVDAVHHQPVQAQQAK